MYLYVSDIKFQFHKRINPADKIPDKIPALK
jgi:hypothetical protein